MGAEFDFGNQHQPNLPGNSKADFYSETNQPELMTFEELEAQMMQASKVGQGPLQQPANRTRDNSAARSLKSKASESNHMNSAPANRVPTIHPEAFTLEQVEAVMRSQQQQVLINQQSAAPGNVSFESEQQQLPKKASRSQKAKKSSAAKSESAKLSLEAEIAPVVFADVDFPVLGKVAKAEIPADAPQPIKIKHREQRQNQKLRQQSRANTSEQVEFFIPRPEEEPDSDDDFPRDVTRPTNLATIQRADEKV